MKPTVSVVINTYNRADSLRQTLTSLEQLDYNELEVVVVDGPSTDQTGAVLREFGARIKSSRIDARNLAASRNIGIQLAAGEIVAFIDDDAHADPAWLDGLVDGYDRGDVAAVGGPVYDHTGVNMQVMYGVVDRYGAEYHATVNPTPYLNRRFSLAFPHLLGTNCSFRRACLTHIGGFDEMFDYYLDETDVCCRIVDKGWTVREVDDAFVYHHRLASHLRNADQAITSYYSIIKNTAYFCLKHAVPYYGQAQATERLRERIYYHRNNRAWLVTTGRLPKESLLDFDSEATQAIRRAREVFSTHRVLSRPAASFSSPPTFVRFRKTRPRSRRLNVCLLSQDWPPRPLGGIGRVVSVLAEGTAKAGAVVHALTRGSIGDTVRLENGVWVHRIVPKPHKPPGWLRVPAHIWDYSASLLDEARRIDAHRKVDVVQAPNWDSEGVAFMVDGFFPTLLGLYTPMKSVRAMDPSIAAEPSLIDALEGLELYCYRNAPAFLASGPAIVDEIEQRYGIHIPAEKLSYAALGLPDVDAASINPVRQLGGTNVLFLGRLESRKGIDTLLACVGAICSEFPDAGFTFVGRDDLPGPGGVPYRKIFESSPAARGLAGRYKFMGQVDETVLNSYYAGCDIFVAPSRYESFGLVLLEAMRLGKPVIASRIGGMAGIVEEGGNGYLIQPGDVSDLQKKLAALLESSERRDSFGRRSRQLFEQRYTAQLMVARTVDAYKKVLATKVTTQQ